MASALNNLQRVDMPLNKETKPIYYGNFWSNNFVKGMNTLTQPASFNW